MALQMTWQPSLLHQKRKNGPPLGLKNIGNTCYLNSVLQCLTYTPPLANFCLKNLHSASCDSTVEPEKKRECPFCVLEKRIARSLSIDQTLDTPSRMNNCLRIFADHFRHGRQEDAHEFLRYVIDACHNTCLRLKKLQQQRRKGGGGGEGLGGSTIVKEIFGGALQSQVKCLSCGGESNKVDEIMDISLDVLHCSSLKVSLQKFFQAEILDGNNKYKCESCKKLVVAQKQLSLLQAPNVLVIQLKRFEGIFGGKIDKNIEFQDVLVLSSYMCKTSQDTHPPEYNLFGTIVHSGSSLDSGHYYAYIKDPMGRWYCCNDACVRVSNLQEVLSEKVYILFFSRTKQKPGPVKPALPSNGVKFHLRNGTDTCRSPKLDNSAKGAHPKHSADHVPENDNLARSQDSKGPPTVQANSSDFGKASTNNSPAIANGKIIVQRSQSNGKHTNGKSPVLTENGYRNMPLVNGNGIAERSTTKKIANGHSQVYHSANGNGITESTPSISVEGGMSKDATGRYGVKEEVTDKPESVNRSVKCTSDILGSKRKLQDEDSCILFGKDANSKEKLVELKESLRKEASSILRSCGWTDEVYDSMCSRKKLCSLEAGEGPSDYKELKKLLMTDAKTKFLSKIPESLKESLIKSLRSFSQQKQFSDP